MAIRIKDIPTEEAVRRLARLKGTSLTEAIREAVEEAYERERLAFPLEQRLKPLQDKIAALSTPGGLAADKAYYDHLSGDT